MSLPEMRLLAFFFLFVLPLHAQVQLTVGNREAELDEAIITCRLHGRFLIREMEFAFLNTGKSTSEGKLICPIAKGERIVSYAMDVNGSRREGVVVPKERGRRAYEEIVARKVDPGILEVNEATGEFTTRVFPIPADHSKRVWITTLQVIDPGEVTLWPSGYGSPRRWSLAFDLAGGSAASAPSDQSGKFSPLPGAVCSWKPVYGLTYASPDVDWHLSFPEKPAVFPVINQGIVELWFDGSVLKIAPSTVARLKELLQQIGNSTIRLRVFRRTSGEPRDFLVKDGGCPELLEHLSKVVPSDMARPRNLPWKKTKAAAIILVTDGVFPEGRGTVRSPFCPLHVIDVGQGDSKWMRSQALATGGGWHGSEGLDPWSGMLRDSLHLGVETSRDIVINSSSNSEALKTPAAKWVHDHIISQGLRETGTPARVLEKFNHAHGIMDSSSVWLVLETAAQYVQYDFEPPTDDQRLVMEWQKLRKKVADKNEYRIEQLATRWQRRCDKLDQKIAPIKDRLLAQLSQQSSYWSEVALQYPEIEIAEASPLLKDLHQTQTLLLDGVQATEKEEIKKSLVRIGEISEKLRRKIPEIRVTVGGRVRQPGSYWLKKPATLKDVIEAAGGADEFGATNRVKIYRQGRVEAYNLKTVRHQAVRVLMDDIIEVPQKIWYGNGGSGGKPRAPFADKKAPVMIIRRGEWTPGKPYLKMIDDLLASKSEWREVYRIQRQILGWRADFYLDLIDLLEKRGMKKDALVLAGELAEHLPESPEALLKAARAFRRLGDHEIALSLFQTIARMMPDTAVSNYDLARAHQSLGQFETALKFYQKALESEDTRYTDGRQIVILEEMNALIARENLDAKKTGIDLRLVRHVPVELRAILEWDATHSNVDLLIRDSSGELLMPRVEGLKGSVSSWSGNVTSGHGPESWSFRGLLPGTWKFGARFYGDWKDDRTSTVTAEIEFIRNFGQPNEVRQREAIRIDEKNHRNLIEVEVAPEGWESRE